jgi:hypothetical protein
MMLTVLLLLLSEPRAEPARWCGSALGLAAGMIDIRDDWERAGQGALLPSASPMLSMGCAIAPAVRLSADVAPWYIHFNLAQDIEIRQWFTATARWFPLGSSLRAGGILTAGGGALGLGLAAAVPLGAGGRELDVRVLNYPTDPLLNVQLQILYTLFRRDI